MKIIDTHAHYDDEAFQEDREQLFEEMFSGPIESIINVGASMQGCVDSVKLADQHKNIYAAVGIHPDDIINLTEERLDWLKEQALQNKKIVAIGEIGLDYFYPEPSKELQITMFRKQLQLAIEVNKPLIIHSRDACADTLLCMKEEHAEKVGGVVHCYSYSKESVRDFMNLGFYFGIGGVCTFKNAKRIVEALEDIPMERLLLETDCPYLAPVPNRGKRNDSRNIAYVVQRISEIKGIAEQEIIDITNQNAKRLFQLD